MKEILVELVALIFVLFFSILLYYNISPEIQKEMKNFTWDIYFKQCGVYQGTSHWTTLKKWLITIKKIVYFLLMYFCFLNCSKHTSQIVLPKGTGLPQIVHLLYFTFLKPTTISWFLVIHLNINLSRWILWFMQVPRIIILLN